MKQSLKSIFTDKKNIISFTLKASDQIKNI